MTLRPGDLVSGRYELGRQLGSGGMARVYLGHDRLLDREVAVKVLSDQFASDPSFVERFRREASAAAGLNHPNIVAVYDRGEADDSYYIVMEYMAGPDLKEVVRARAPLPPLEAIDYAQQILAALGAAHRRDVIHRDVKPQNVLVAADGHLKVTDFGIARAGTDGGITEAGSVIGTAQYLSPEQARGDEVTAASDCYAVGIVLYEMLTGRVPFDGERPVTVAMKQISDPPAPPTQLEPGVPPVLEGVVLRALAKRPSERYRTAEEMSQALGDARAAIQVGDTTRVLPAAAVPAGPPTAQTRMMEPATGQTRVAPPPPPPPARRRAWPAIAGILVVLAAIAAGAFVFLSGDDARSVTIPPVANQPAAAATRALEDLNLEVTRQRVEDAQVAVDTAIRTDPAAGTEVKEGDTVILVVSGGPGQATVPDVVGDREEDARAALDRAGFEATVTSEASDTDEEGIVIRQDPAGEEQATRGSPVALAISSGPAKVTVPDVRRRTQTEAEQRLRDAGLVPSSTTQPSTSFAPGIVIDQDPGPTAKVDRDSTVTITVAVAPANVGVPSGIVGSNADEARFKLEQLGFTVTSDEAASEDDAGIVIDVSPDEGTQVAPDSTIVITVSTGPATETTGDLSGIGRGRDKPDKPDKPGKKR